MFVYSQTIGKEKKQSDTDYIKLSFISKSLRRLPVNFHVVQSTITFTLTSFFIEYSQFDGLRQSVATDIRANKRHLSGGVDQALLNSFSQEHLLTSMWIMVHTRLQVD